MSGYHSRVRRLTDRCDGGPNFTIRTMLHVQVYFQMLRLSNIFVFTQTNALIRIENNLATIYSLLIKPWLKTTETSTPRARAYSLATDDWPR